MDNAFPTFRILFDYVICLFLGFILCVGCSKPKENAENKSNQAATNSDNKISTASNTSTDGNQVSVSTPASFISNNRQKADLVQLTEAIVKDPLLPKLYLDRGKIFAEKKMYDLAKRDFSTATELDPNLAEVYCEHAKVELALKNWYRALYLAQEYLLKKPQQAEAYLLMGQTYLFNSDEQELAQVYFNEAESIDPILKTEVAKLLDEYSRFKQDKEASNKVAGNSKDQKIITAAKPVITDDNVFTLIQKARNEIAEKYFDDALLTLKDVKANETYEADIHFERGRAFLGNKAALNAIQEFTNTIRLKPGLEAAYFDRSKAYAASEQYALAIDDATETIGLNPTKSDYYLHRGLLFISDENYSQAINDLSKAAALRTDPAEKKTIYLHLADALFMQGKQNLQRNKWNEALKYLTNAYAYNAKLKNNLYPFMARAYRGLAVQYQRVGDLHNALDVLEKAYKTEPDNPDNARYLGIVHYKLENYPQAAFYLSEAINLDPDLEVLLYRYLEQSKRTNVNVKYVVQP